MTALSALEASYYDIPEEECRCSDECRRAWAGCCGGCDEGCGEEPDWEVLAEDREERRRERAL